MSSLVDWLADVTTVPDDRGVFVSLSDIYREQIGQGRALDRLQSDVEDLAQDTTDLKNAIRAMQERQWPLPLIGLLIALAALVVPFLAR
jgi:hypothetical protein